MGMGSRIRITRLMRCSRRRGICRLLVRRRILGRAMFAYNHAGWYVQSVLLRARLIGGMPAGLIGALTGLVQGRFPVAARARYADDSVERLATRRVRGANAAIPVDSNPAARGDVDLRGRRARR